jgi:hypothetical protein
MCVPADKVKDDAIGGTRTTWRTKEVACSVLMGEIDHL